MLDAVFWSIFGNAYIPIALLFLLLDIALCITVVFLERKNPSVALAWVLAFIVFPIIGIIIYMFFGRHLYGARIFSKKTEADIMYKNIAREQLERWHEYHGETLDAEGFEKTAALLLNADDAIFTDNNKITVFTDGEEKFAALFDAIRSAKHHIHIEYFIIRDDDLGRKIVALLAEKAAEGVEVRAIFDAAGTFRIHKKKFFGSICRAGGDVRIFFPLKIPFLNTRLHFRNHRKILVVDGRVGFIGGFNIGDEYLGKGRMGYWRDTHLRIEGSAVASLQRRFVMDWNYAAKDARLFVSAESGEYFPAELMEEHGTSRVQIASSGPDSPDRAIYSGYISLIGQAKESIYIHTPYFIPDEAMYTALLLAARSGVDVRVVIPCKPDHPFVYWANHSYIGDLLAAGVRGYTYNDGFIHSKASVFDGKAATVGTANWDIRSFKLNFETNAFVYDQEICEKMRADFLAELETNCTEITQEMYANRSVRVRIREGVSRLMSPLL